jgi:hypothetical protein
VKSPSAAALNNCILAIFCDISRHFATEKDTRKARFTARTINSVQNTTSPQIEGIDKKIAQQHCTP